MRLTTPIKEYEMDEVILYLGSDANVLQNKLGIEWGDLCCSGLLSSYAWKINRRSSLWGSCVGLLWILKQRVSWTTLK